MGIAGSRWQGCVTRRLRTVTKIFKNMYLSGRTAVQFQSSAPGGPSPSPTPLPSPAARSLRRAIFISRFLPAAAHRPRSKGCLSRVCADILCRLSSSLYPILKLAQRASTSFVPQQTVVIRQDDLKDNFAR